MTGALRIHVFDFFFNPRPYKAASAEEKRMNLWFCIRFAFLAYFLYALLLYTDGLLGRHFEYKSMVALTRGKFADSVTHFHAWRILLMGVIVLPFIEEAAFRAFLDFKRISVAVTIGGLTCIMLRSGYPLISDESLKIWITVPCGVATGLVAYFLIKESFLKRLKGHFKTLFYLSNLGFVMLHALNYDLADFSVLNFLVLPFLLTPQIIGSLVFSFLRIRNGFLWSYSFHAIDNAIFSLPLLINGFM